MPCLKLADGRVLGQSLAIIDLLGHIAPELPILLLDPVARAATLAVALFIDCETTPLQRKLLRGVLVDDYGFTPEQDRSWTQR